MAILALVAMFATAHLTDIALADEPIDAGGFTFNSSAEFVDSGRRCATPPPPKLDVGTDKNFVNAFRMANPVFIADGTKVTIPVYFHVITDGKRGDVSDKSLDQELIVMNAAYSRTNFQFKRYAKATRTNRRAWFQMRRYSNEERAAKKELGKDPRRILHIYTIGSTNRVLGWAAYPWDLDNDPDVDGVVIDYRTLPEVENWPYNLGLTAVHETGHWLGLLHTFENGCRVPGDEVDDTAAEGDYAKGCPSKSRDTCPEQTGTDPVDNYMDYEDDACMSAFTAGQLSRMKIQVGLYRTELIEPALRKATAFAPLLLSEPM